MPEESLREVISRPTRSYAGQHLERKERLDDSSVHVTAMVGHQNCWTLFGQAFPVVHLAIALFPDNASEVKCVYSHSDVDQVGHVSHLMKLEVYCLKDSTDSSEKDIGHGYLQIVVWVAEFRSVAI